MKTNVDIQKIAKYTIFRLMQNGQSICPLKLQKLLYYIQAWHMVYFNRENTLFNEAPEAWVNGPVYRTIYEKFRNIGIYDQITLEDVSNNIEDLEESTKIAHDELNLDKEQYHFLESIYRHYGSMSHDRLVFLTHSQLPWNNARKGLQPFEYTNEKISLDDMFNYYSKSIKQ